MYEGFRKISISAVFKRPTFGKIYSSPIFRAGAGCLRCCLLLRPVWDLPESTTLLISLQALPVPGECSDLSEIFASWNSLLSSIAVILENTIWKSPLAQGKRSCHCLESEAVRRGGGTMWAGGLMLGFTRMLMSVLLLVHRSGWETTPGDQTLQAADSLEPWLIHHFQAMLPTTQGWEAPSPSQSHRAWPFY